MESGTVHGRRLATATFALLVLALTGAALFALLRDEAPELRGGTDRRRARDDAGGSVDEPPFDPIDAARRAEEIAATSDAVASLDAAAMRTLALRGRARFVGLVFHPWGVACPDAQLFVRGEPAGRSDERGAYEIEVAHQVGSGSFQLAARAEGVGSMAMVVDGPSRRIDLHLEGGGRVRGRAFDWRGGAPVADAEVELLAAKGLLDSSVAGDVFGHGYRLVTRCDGEGRFAFDHVPTVGGFSLRAFAPGHDNLMWHEFGELGDGEERVVELALRRRVAVRGRFAPWPPRGVAAGANFTVRAVAERELTTTPDADGRFELALTEYATWRLTLESGRARLFSTSFPIPPDSPPIDFGRIDLVEPSTVVGRIDLPPELLAFGFVVRGRTRDGEERLAFEVPVASDGRFEVGSFVMDACELQLAWSGDGGFGGRHGLGCWRTEFPVERGARVDIGDLRPLTPLLAGRVVDELGAPLAGAEIRWRRAEAEGDPKPDPMRVLAAAFVAARTDVAGRFVLPANNEPGTTMQLRANSIGRAGNSPLLSVGATSQVIADLVLGGGRRVHGRLLAADGTPVVGARVMVDSRWQIDETWFGELVDSTAVDGTFEFVGLEPRAYTPLVVLPDGFNFEPPPIETGTTELTWSVPPPEPEASFRRDP